MIFLKDSAGNWMNILPIVEGQSEVESVPILIRRLLDMRELCSIGVCKPFRVKRNQVVKDERLEAAIQVAIRNRIDVGAILVLLDADDDCPKELGPNLLSRSKKITDLPVSVTIAKRELECWFLGAKESLRGHRGIKEDAESPQNPEEIDGKGGLKRNMIHGSKYLEVDDQPAFAQRFDLTLASQKCPSLERFIREIIRLFNEMIKSE